MRFSEPTTKISMKIDLHYQRRRRSPMILDSVNIKFMQIFAVVLKICINFPYACVHIYRYGMPFSLQDLVVR